MVLNHETIILNAVHSKPTHILNCICLLTKQYIYGQRCLGKQLQMSELKALIMQQENVEKYIATKNSSLTKHYAKWNCSGGEEGNSLEEYLQQYMIQLPSPEW